jgi:hypothetical protein
MHDPYTGSARVSFKCSDAMAELLRASAAFEHRSESQICRMALAAFFESRGYFDPENIAALAAGKAVTNE